LKLLVDSAYDVCDNVFIERGFEMDSNTIAKLIGGFAVKAVAAGFAIYVAVTVGEYVHHVFTAVNVAMNVVK
jgi:hypothetical protein